MFRQVFFTALLTGVIAGLFFTAVQIVQIMPMIAQAEVFEAEGGSGNHGTEAHSHDSGGHDNGVIPFMSAGGSKRLGMTVMTNILTGIGFALLLTAAFAIRGSVDWRRGLLWGLGGFAAFSLAPSLGLPPELPGMQAADLSERQIWWVATVAATAAGLSLFVFSQRGLFKILAVVVIFLPHIVGAPRPVVEAASSVPAELAAAFVSASLIANLLFWLVIGGVSGYAFKRFAGHKSEF